MDIERFNDWLEAPTRHPYANAGHYTRKDAYMFFGTVLSIAIGVVIVFISVIVGMGAAAHWCFRKP